MLDLIGTIVVLLLVAPPLLIALGGLLFLAAALLPDTRRVRETFRCPLQGRTVTTDFLVPSAARHPSSVVRCTAFRNPEEVTCKKPCRELATVRWGLSRVAFPRWALTAGPIATWRETESPENRPA